MHLAPRKLLAIAAFTACGTAVSVAVAAGSSTSAAPTCAAAEPQTIHSSRAGADAALVPDGAQQLLLCRYGGLNDSPRLGLLGSKLVTDAGTVTSLATEINGLPQGPAGPTACPNDDGSAIIAYFDYPSGPNDPVSVEETGCGIVSNGFISRTDSTSPLVGRLQGLVPPKPAPPGRRNATIAGYVRLCGGPAPGRCWTSTIGSCAPHQGCITTDRVTIVDGNDDQVAEAKLHHARFGLKVPAGRYTVKLLSDGRTVHGRVTATRTVTVRAGHTATVRFQFDVP
jgi:hypothetical protein